MSSGIPHALQEGLRVATETRKGNDQKRSLNDFQQGEPMSTNQVNAVNTVNPINGTLAPADQGAIMAAIGTIKQSCLS